MSTISHPLKWPYDPDITAKTLRPFPTGMRSKHDND